MTRSRSRRKTIQAIAKLFVLYTKTKKAGRLLQSILSYTLMQNGRKGKTKAIDDDDDDDNDDNQLLLWNGLPTKCV